MISNNPSLWVYLSTIIFVLLVYKPAGRVLAKILDGHRDKIKDELAQAVKLREEAQKTLGECQKKVSDAEKEVDRIISDARRFSQNIKNETRKTLDNEIKNKIQFVDNQIEKNKQEALEEIKNEIVSQATELSVNLLTGKLQSKLDENLFDQATKQLQKVA